MSKTSRDQTEEKLRTAEERPPALKLEGIQAHYGREKAFVLDIDCLAIDQGEQVAVIGPSGAGKTTLLRLINGYVAPTRGRLEILGQAVNRSALRKRSIRRQVGFVFQNFNLVERATVFENVLWGRLGRVSPWGSLLGRFSEEDKASAMQAIAEVDLIGQADQRVDTLSGGQEQRVGVARVVAQGARIVLADEPVSNLDPALVDDILGLLVGVSDRHGTTLLMSLHQPALARRYADRLIGMRAGRVVYDDQVENLSQTDLRDIYDRERIPALETPPA